jgi:hypothetical protein
MMAPSALELLAPWGLRTLSFDCFSPSLGIAKEHQSGGFVEDSNAGQGLVPGDVELNELVEFKSTNEISLVGG